LLIVLATIRDESDGIQDHYLKEKQQTKKEEVEEDEAGEEIDDAKRSYFFQVWGDGRHYRFVAFASIALLETDAPISA